MALSQHSGDLTSGVADGVEFEETFPESTAPEPEVVRSPEPEILKRAPEPVHVEQSHPSITRLTVVSDGPAPRRAPAEKPAELGDDLERKLRDSETRIVSRIELALEEWQSRMERRLRQVEHAINERPLGDVRRDATRGELAGLRDAIASASTAREAGRVMRDAVAGIARTSVFALALHVDRSDDVAYRYRVATEDKVGDVLRGEALDDGPLSPAAYTESWLRAQRPIRAGGRTLTLHTAQTAVRDDRTTVGVLTLLSDVQISDPELAQIAAIVSVAAPRLAELRDAGRFAGPAR